MPRVVNPDPGDDVARTVLGMNISAPQTQTAAPLLGTAPIVSSTPLGTAPIVSSTPSPGQGVALTPSGVLPSSAAATGIRMLTADQASPLTGEFWFRADLNELSIKTASGVKRTVPFT